MADDALSKYFGGVYVANQAPKSIDTYPKVLIVNTEPSDEPGVHWLRVWFNDDESAEFYDSYAMPLHYYSKNIQHFERRPILQDILWACKNPTQVHVEFMYFMFY